MKNLVNSHKQMALNFLNPKKVLIALFVLMHYEDIVPLHTTPSLLQGVGANRLSIEKILKNHERLPATCANLQVRADIVEDAGEEQGERAWGGSEDRLD